MLVTSRRVRPLPSVRGMVSGPHLAFVVVGGGGPLAGAHAPARGRLRNPRVRRGEILSRESGGTDPTPLGSDKAEPFPGGSDVAGPIPKRSGEAKVVPKGPGEVGAALRGSNEAVVTPLIIWACLMLVII
jgi:hypothetical protein